MKTVRNSLIQPSIRYGAYPAVMIGTALVLLWSGMFELLERRGAARRDRPATSLGR